MIQLRTNKNFGLLRKVCSDKNIKLKRSTVNNVTRWSSTCIMLQKFKELHPLLSFNMEFHHLRSILLDGDEYFTLESILPHFEDLEKVTIALQREGMTIYEARLIFDEVIKQYGLLSNALKKYLSSSYQFSPFESGVIKVFKGEELNIAESMALRRFKKNEEKNEEEEKVDSVNENDGILQVVERAMKRQRTSNDHDTGKTK
jgi:hypothetical protein